MKKKSTNKQSRDSKTTAVPTARKGDLRRLEIVEAAIQCIAREGIARFSYEQLSEITGLKRSHINYYFPSLESLIEATFSHVIAHGQALTTKGLAAGAGRKDLFKVYIEATLGWFREHPSHVSTMLLFAHFSTFDPRCRELNVVAKKFGEERLYSLIRELKPKASKEDIQVWATSVRNLIIGEAIDYFACTPLASYPALIKRVYAHAKKIFS